MHTILTYNKEAMVQSQGSFLTARKAYFQHKGPGGETNHLLRPLPSPRNMLILWVMLVKLST